MGGNDDITRIASRPVDQPVERSGRSHSVVWLQEGTRLITTILGLALGTTLSQGHARLTAQVVGLLVGYLVGRPIGAGVSRASLRAGSRFEQIHTPNLVLGLFMGVMGVIVAYIISYPLRYASLVPSSLGLAVTGLLIWLFGGAAWLVGKTYTDSILASLGVSTRPLIRVHDYADGTLLDTSIIMRGSLLQLASTGLLPGELLIPGFILDELQNWADGNDPHKSKLARSGLEQLRVIREQHLQKVSVLPDQVPEATTADSKLVHLAQRMRVAIATNDVALASTAELAGVKTINLQPIQDRMIADVQTGDQMTIDLVDKGREPGQAVGWLTDGCMVIVNDGCDRVGSKAEIVITNSINTPKGRLYFARLVA